MCTVPQTLWKLRAFYFLTGLSGGLFVPYLSMLLVQNGLNSGEVGQVMATGTVVAILAQPLWGLVVDRFHVTRLTLALSAVMPGLVAVLYNIPWLWLVALANAVSNLFSAPQAPIADAYAVATARALRTSYGTIRCLASLGFAVGGYAGGLFLAHLPLQWLWIPYAVTGLCGALITLTFPRETHGVGLGGSFQEGLMQLLRDRRFLVFLAGGFLVSQTLTAFNTYFALTFRDMGGSIALTGLAFLLASGTNVPSMLIAARLNHRLGRERMMAIAAIAYILRWSIQALVPIPWVAIAIQVLHGISFGFYYVAAVDFVFSSAPPQLQATAQSIFGMICGGLAGIVGNLLNGILLHSGGAAAMYWACTVSSALGAACFWYVAKVRRPAGPRVGLRRPVLPWVSR